MKLQTQSTLTRTHTGTLAHAVKRDTVPRKTRKPAVPAVRPVSTKPASTIYDWVQPQLQVASKRKLGELTAAPEKKQKVTKPKRKRPAGGSTLEASNQRDSQGGSGGAHTRAVRTTLRSECPNPIFATASLASQQP